MHGSHSPYNLVENLEVDFFFFLEFTIETHAHTTLILFCISGSSNPHPLEVGIKGGDCTTRPEKNDDKYFYSLDTIFKTSI